MAIHTTKAARRIKGSVCDSSEMTGVRMQNVLLSSLVVRAICAQSTKKSKRLEALKKMG